MQVSAASGHPRLDDAAIAAVQKARFKPHTRERPGDCRAGRSIPRFRIGESDREHRRSPRDASLCFSISSSQSDAVGKTLLAILIVDVESPSWAIIAVKGSTLVLRNGRSREFLELLLERDLARGGGRRDRHARRARSVLAPDQRTRCTRRRTTPSYGAAKLEEAGSAQRLRHAHHQEGARRGNDAAGERPHRARHRRRHRALRRPVRHRLGRLPRAGGHRHERRRHARQGRRPGGRGADHDRRSAWRSPSPR